MTRNEADQGTRRTEARTHPPDRPLPGSAGQAAVPSRPGRPLGLRLTWGWAIMRAHGRPRRGAEQT